MAIDGNNIVGVYIDADNVSHGFEATVPEPATLTLMALGLGGFALLRKRRNAS
jgi:hypothetical protein